ncbi:type VI secretion system contractile sheath small subunit [Thermodesulfobacteriota bacterium B35]
MAKEASVAPKERVNIVYRPATGDAQEEVELPLKLLIMGDFTLSEDERPLEEREAINVDKDNFDEVLKAQNISLSLTVPNKLSDEPDEEMNVTLGFESMKDFGPEAIAEKTPELKKLLELRRALTALKGPLSNVPEFRKKIQNLVGDDAAREQLLKELGVDDK